VKVTENEFTITLAPTSASAGNVSIAATNTGAVAHEFVLVKTDLAPDKLPLTGDNTQADLSKVQTVGTVAQFDPGKAANGSFTLTAGKYVALCNLPAHYVAGMRTSFTVK
jgi:uncharacterized cupredoxin-like copper-binding protein